MNRALMWKEWRQQRPLIFAGIGAALLLPLFVFVGTMGSFRTDSLTQVIPALQVLAVLPIFAYATGAMTFAEDRSEGTLGYLMSRPASHVRIWLVKVGVAGGVFLAIGILVSGVTKALGALVAGPTIHDLDPYRLQTSFFSPTQDFIRSTFVQHTTTGMWGGSLFLTITITSPLFLLLAFSAAVFFSTRTKRTLNAVLYAIVATLAILAVQFLVAAAETRLSPGTLSVSPRAPLYFALVFLIASFISFKKTDLSPA